MFEATGFVSNAGSWWIEGTTTACTATTPDCVAPIADSLSDELSSPAMTGTDAIQIEGTGNLGSLILSYPTFGSLAADTTDPTVEANLHVFHDIGNKRIDATASLGFGGTKISDTQFTLTQANAWQNNGYLASITCSTYETDFQALMECLQLI